jgi:hypothetical protein
MTSKGPIGNREAFHHAVTVAGSIKLPLETPQYDRDVPLPPPHPPYCRVTFGGEAAGGGWKGSIASKQC